MGLILDSSIVISAERSGQTAADLLDRIVTKFGDQPAAISAVGLTELVHGVYRAYTPEILQRREAFLQELTSLVAVYPYTAEVAWLAGRIDAEQRTGGVVIPFADLLIGATVLSLGFDVLTLNLRDFRRIPRLSVHLIE